MSSVRELQELFLDSRLRGNDEAVELLRFSPKMDMSVPDMKNNTWIHDWKDDFEHGTESKHLLK